MTLSVDVILSALDVRDALLGVMVLSSMSDGSIRVSELVVIEAVIDHSPIFAHYNDSDVKKVFGVMKSLVRAPYGIDSFLAYLKKTLPPALRETAYLLACEVAVADSKLSQAELRFLEELSYYLEIEPLYVAAIERNIRARYVKP